MPKQSAGILLYRPGSEPQVLLVHPGGPFFVNKDEGSWQIPKGEFEPGDDPQAAALREFEEETGHRVEGPMQPLGTHRQPGGKTVHAWAMAGDCDATNIRSNTFRLEW